MTDDVVVWRYVARVGEVCESKWSYVLEVPAVDFIRPCGVVVFALFYCHLDLCCGECHAGCLQPECVPTLCLTVLVDRLPNVPAIRVGEASVFPLKATVLPLGCVGVLPASPCIVFQRVCVVCL